MDYLQLKPQQQLKMPFNQDIFCGNCDHCDYEWWVKSNKVETMVKRLHNKKCPKTGRTKKPEWKDRLLAEREVFCRTMKNTKIEVGGEKMSVEHYLS
jgi:hypothetical protein